MIRNVPLRKTPLKRYPIKRAKRSKPGGTQVSPGTRSLDTGAVIEPTLSLIQFYEQIWLEREHFSFISGLPIPYPTPSNFAHVLAKGIYKKFSRYKKNIILVLEYEHFLIDHGHSGLRETYAKKYPGCWDNLGTLKDELLAEYNQLRD